jgi:hypothetical protein
MTATRIWTYWDQGETAAPELVQLCWESWRRRNPDSHLVIVDRGSVCKHGDLPYKIDLSRPDLTVQKISDLVRLDLLSRHGGVWVDATLYCSEPLKNWLPPYMQSGFFAFRNPGPDRLLSSWFLAADLSNELIREFAARYTGLYSKTRYTRQNTLSGEIIRRLLKPLLSKRVTTSRHWVEKPWPGLLKTYPYFQAHYTFNSMILGDPAMAELWQSVPSFPACGPHFLARCAREADGTRQAIDFIETKACPVHKLNWRTNIESDYWKIVLGALSRACAVQTNRDHGSDRPSSGALARPRSSRRSCL